MKRKLEHLAAKLAFEELDGVQPGSAAADADVERAVEEYRSMRAGLKRLAEKTPEPSLSAERLRDAILAAGLEKRPAASRNWNWAWAPAAAAVFAVAYMGSRHAPPPTRYVANTTAPVASLPSILKQPEPSPAVSAPYSAPIVAKAVETHRRRAVEHHPVVVVDASTHRPEPNIIALIGRLAPQLIPATSDSVMKMAGRFASAGTTPLGGAHDMVAKDGKSEPIVLIQPDLDGQTGASRATEVESVANVLIGG